MASLATPPARTTRSDNSRQTLKSDLSLATRSPSKRKRNDSVSSLVSSAQEQQLVLGLSQDAQLKSDAVSTALEIKMKSTPDSSDNEDEPLPCTPQGRRFAVDADEPISGSASPRTMVARKLEDLDIASEKTLQAQSPRLKKAKIVETSQSIDNAEDKKDDVSRLPSKKFDFGPFIQSSQSDGGPVKHTLSSSYDYMVIPDTPHVESTIEDNWLENPSVHEDNLADTIPSPSRSLTVPQLTTPFTFTSTQTQAHQVHRANSSLPRPDEESQFWSLSEITGHNPDDPDDDGTGINGVGFKPTPAMAAVRANRRKQQIDAWRKREAEESRRRRAEIRSGSLLRSKIRREEAKDAVAAAAVAAAAAEAGVSEAQAESERAKNSSPESLTRRMVRFAT